MELYNNCLVDLLRPIDWQGGHVRLREARCIQPRQAKPSFGAEAGQRQGAGTRIRSIHNVPSAQCQVEGLVKEAAESAEELQADLVSNAHA